LRFEFSEILKAKQSTLFFTRFADSLNGQSSKGCVFLEVIGLKKIGAIILAGGKGERFGAEIPKQFISLNGKPIISYCYDTFNRHPDISYVVVSTHEEWMQEVKKIARCNSVKGGSAESSLIALLACDNDTDYMP
jgi:hypothetical protein